MINLKIKITSDDDNDTTVPPDLKMLTEKYVDSDCHLLTKYLKNEIIKYFPGCTKHQVDKARKFQSKNDTFALPSKSKYKQNKLDIAKCEHFLDFIFNSCLLQDVFVWSNQSEI